AQSSSTSRTRRSDTHSATLHGSSGGRRPSGTPEVLPARRRSPPRRRSRVVLVEELLDVGDGLLDRDLGERPVGPAAFDVRLGLFAVPPVPGSGEEPMLRLFGVAPGRVERRDVDAPRVVAGVQKRDLAVRADLLVLVLEVGVFVEVRDAGRVVAVIHYQPPRL